MYKLKLSIYILRLSFYILRLSIEICIRQPIFLYKADLLTNCQHQDYYPTTSFHCICCMKITLQHYFSQKTVRKFNF